MKRHLRKAPDARMNWRIWPYAGKYAAFLCLAVIAATGVLNAGNSNDRGRILVLGFGTAFLNDVQDMILRERS